MRKIRGVFFTVLMIFLLSTAAQAEVIGKVLSTDIGTVIDGAACKTYNIDGRTFVVAEDLRGYGFAVEWDENARVLSITQNPYTNRTLLGPDEVNIKKKDCVVGEPLMDILSSDVVVTVAGEPVEGYNIDGYMVIPVRALEPYAYVEYNDEDRLVRIKGLQHYLDERYKAGNPYVTQEIREYTDETYGKKYQPNIGALSDVSEGTVDVREVITNDTENGSIYSHYGNPCFVFNPTGLGAVYYLKNSYDVEIYKIIDAEGNLLFYSDTLYRTDGKYRYIINSDYTMKINASNDDYLYNYSINYQREHGNDWTLESDINKTIL